jgi:hypothetical protein
MKYLAEIFVKIQPATWIAIASLFVSIAALILSNRRRSFDMKLMGAKKATELRTLFLEYKRKTSEFLEAVNAWEKVCAGCELYPEHAFPRYRESAESFRKFADDCLRGLDSPVSKETAIRLEPITAYGDDLCKKLSAVTERCRKNAEDCKAKKISSEQDIPADYQRSG